MWPAIGLIAGVLIICNVIALLAVSQRLAAPQLTAHAPPRARQIAAAAAAVAACPPLSATPLPLTSSTFRYVADAAVEKCATIIRARFLLNESAITTMVALDRREATLWLAGQALARSELRGAFIETGVAGGGMSVLMRAMQLCVASARGGAASPFASTLKASRLYMADSWEGLPDGNGRFEAVAEKDGNLFAGNYRVGWAAFHAAARSAGAAFDALGWGDGRAGGGGVAHFELEKTARRGWFKDTLPALLAEEGQALHFSFLRLDGDMYVSTYEALESLYPRLECGGLVYVDGAFVKTRKSCKYARPPGGLVDGSFS